MKRTVRGGLKIVRGPTTSKTPPNTVRRPNNEANHSHQHVNNRTQGREQWQIQRKGQIEANLTGGKYRDQEINRREEPEEGEGEDESQRYAQYSTCQAKISG